MVRVLGALTARSYADGPIAPSGTTLNKVADIFQSGSEHVPFENVLQGMLSISWGGFFLELYRAIEQLYAVPRLAALVEAWPTSLPYRSLADLLESHLAWRPKEDDALAKIIAECDDTIVAPLRESFSDHRDGDRLQRARPPCGDRRVEAPRVLGRSGVFEHLAALLLWHLLASSRARQGASPRRPPCPEQWLEHLAVVSDLLPLWLPPRASSLSMAAMVGDSCCSVMNIIFSFQ